MYGFSVSLITLTKLLTFEETKIDCLDESFLFTWAVISIPFSKLKYVFGGELNMVFQLYLLHPWISNNKSKSLCWPTYSLPNNLLKEVLLKMGFKFVITNEISKAGLIIGLKDHLKQNFKLTNLAKQKNIPVYALNQVSFYQLSKLIKFISV